MPLALPIDTGLKGSPFGVDITKGFMPNVRDPETDEWISQDELTRRLAERAQQNAQPPAPPTAPETPPESPSRPDVALADPNTADETTKLTGAVQTARRGPFAALADVADQGAQVTREAQQADENRPPSNLGPLGDVAGSLRRFGKSVLGATAQEGAGVATLEEQARNKAIQDQIDSMGQDVVSRGVSKLERKATAPVEGPVGTVLETAQNAAGDVAEKAGTALGQGIFPSAITQQGGYAGPSEGAKKVGSVLRAGAESAIPRSPLDLTMTAAPFAGEATRVARGAVERVAATETGQAIREGLAAGESGMVRPMPGGITKAEATRRRNAFLSAPSSDTGRAGVQLRQPAPFTEEMGYVGEGLQLSPEHLGLPPIEEISSQLAALRKAPKGKTAQIGKLEAQLEARQAIESKDAQGAFQQIADSYATQHGQTPAARAKIEELGRIHNDMLSPEDVGNFHPNALQEAPAGAEFDPMSHEIRSRGPQAQTLPGTETAGGSLPKQPPPVMGSMQDEAFRGEQGGLQGGLEGVNATTAERYQPGLAEGAAPAADVAPAGTPAAHVNELDDLLAARASVRAGGREAGQDLDRRIVELGKRTPFDNADVIAARAEQAAQPPTRLINTPERLQLREQIANKLYGEGASQRGRIADIVLGPPAAGKSSALAGPLAKENGALVIDSDAAKEFLPEFQGGRFAGVVHGESDGIAANVLNRAVATGDNIVLPLVGKNQDKIAELGALLKRKGYQVRLHMVEIPPDEAARRAVERFGTTGRFVDPDYVLNEVDSHPRHTFDNLKGEDWVSGSQRVSNDVARGTRPATLETTFDRPAVSPGAAGPGINDAGRLPAGATEPGAANAGTPVADALSTVSNANTAATAATPAGSGSGDGIPGLAESLTPEGRAAIVRRRAGTIASPSAAEPALTEPHVVQPDGARAPATPENVQSGVRRVLSRPSGLKIPPSALSDPAKVREVLLDAVTNAKTLGGRPLFGPGTDSKMIEDGLTAVVNDGRFQITHTGGRGRIAAVFKADDEPGALIKAVDDVASTHRPEAGVENVAASSEAPAAPGSTLPGHGVPPASTREAAQPAAARGASETFKPTEGYVPAPAPKPGELAPVNATAEELANVQAERRAAREAALADRRQPTAPTQPTLDYQGGAVPSGVEPAPATRTLAQQRLERGLENAGPPSGGMGSGEGPTPPVKPPAGGVGQAGFPWKPGQNLGHAFLTAAADVLFGVPRALKFGFDQSAALRQGLWDSLAHPAITVTGAPERYLASGELNPAFGRGRGKAIAEAIIHPGQELSGIARSLSHPQGALVEQFKAFSRALLHATPEETDSVYARIGRRYGDLKASYTDAQGNVHPGLYKAERGAAASLTAREEQLASSILYHVPGLRRLMRASEDSFAMFLSKQRDDVFDNWIDTYRRLTGDMPSKAEANDISRWINIKSGRGELPQNWANAFTVPFTAPRLYAAQIERLPVIAPLMLHSAEVRKQMVYDWIAVFGSLSTGVALADLSGLGSVDTDFSHPSADFLKIRIGNHRIDPWGGYAQLARLSARLASGARAGAGGAIYDSSWKQELTNFALSKLAPTAALANDIISGHDFNHNELHWDFDSVKNEIGNLYAPLMFQDLIQGFKDDGLKGLAISAPTFLGLSVQTYPPGVAELRTKAAQAEGHADYASAPQSVKDKIDAQPNIAPLVAKLPTSPYQQAKSAAMDPIMADQQRAEESFTAGTNDTLIQDLWHDENEQRKGARAALEAAFTKSFSGRQKNQFDKALDGFYAPELEVKRPDGSPDFDATEVKKQAYLDSLPQVQRDWINDFTDTAAKNKTPLRQEYLAYLDERKKLGYFDANVKPADQARLDRENPDQDVANWKFKHTTTSDNTLNSVEAVNKALALDLPNRTVKVTLPNVGSLQRPVNQSEQSRQAFSDTQKLMNDYGAAKVKYQDVERQRLAQMNAAYAKPFDKLTTEQQSTIHANIGRSLQINSPKLDAVIAWWGTGKSDTLNSQAAVAEYRKLQQQYGSQPTKEGHVVNVAPGAR